MSGTHAFEQTPSPVAELGQIIARRTRKVGDTGLHVFSRMIDTWVDVEAALTARSFDDDSSLPVDRVISDAQFARRVDIAIQKRRAS